MEWGEGGLIMAMFSEFFSNCCPSKHNMFSTDHREYVTQCDYRVLPKKCRLFKFKTRIFLSTVFHLTPQPEKDEKLIKIIQCDLFNHYSTLGSGAPLTALNITESKNGSV